MKNIKKITKITFIASVLIFTVISAVFYTVSTKQAIASEDYEHSLSLVNRIRAENNLDKLKYNQKLSDAALEKASDCFKNNYFDHVSPMGAKAWDFIKQQDYNYIVAGENLASDFDNVDQAMDAWKESPTHYKNIISSNFNEYGFAQLNGNLDGKSTTIYVQIFASNKSIYDNILSALQEE